MFLDVSYTLSVTSQFSDNGITQKKFISVPIDAKGNLIAQMDLTPLFYFVFPFIMAFLLHRSGQTPGKRMLNLKVVKTGKLEESEAEQISLKTALTREYARNIILIVTGITMLPFFYYPGGVEKMKSYASLLPDGDFIVSPVFITITIALSIAAFWYMFGSFIRWQGQAFWDRFAGTIVK